MRITGRRIARGGWRHTGTSTSTAVPGARRRAHLGATLQVGREVLDEGEAEVTPVAAACAGGGVEAAAVVADRQPRAAVVARHLHRNRRGAACAPDSAQGLYAGR